MSYTTLSTQQKPLFQKRKDNFFTLFILSHTSDNTTSLNIGRTNAWAVPHLKFFLGGPSLPGLRPCIHPSIHPSNHPSIHPSIHPLVGSTVSREVFDPNLFRNIDVSICLRHSHPL